MSFGVISSISCSKPRLLLRQVLPSVCCCFVWIRFRSFGNVSSCTFEIAICFDRKGKYLVYKWFQLKLIALSDLRVRRGRRRRFSQTFSTESRPPDLKSYRKCLILLISLPKWSQLISVFCLKALVTSELWFDLSGAAALDLLSTII